MADKNGQTTHNLWGLDLLGQDDGQTQKLTLLTDALGSVRVQMRGTSLQATTSYGPYGSIHQQMGTSQTSYGYTGEQFHAGTGLLYLRARYYSPALHAFTARDSWVGSPQRPTTLHDYNYADNNPIRYTDPSGFCAESGDDGCWSIYERIVHLCSQCTNMTRPMPGGDRGLHEENMYYLQSILDNLTAPPYIVSGGLATPFNLLSFATPFQVYAYIQPHEVSSYREQIYNTGTANGIAAGQVCQCAYTPQQVEVCIQLQNDSRGDPSLMGFGQLALGAVQIALNKVEQGEALHPALALTLDWYFEKGEQTQRFGPNNQITRDLMVYEGTRRIIRDWIGKDRPSTHSGYVGFNSPSTVLGETRNALSNGNWTISFLGSYKVYITTLGSQRNGSVIQVRVTNATGWDSATRIPGQNGLRPNENRGSSGYGGTLDQEYQWTELVP